MSLAVAYAVQSVVAEHIISNTCQAATHIVAGNPMTSHLVPAQLVALARKLLVILWAMLRDNQPLRGTGTAESALRDEIAGVT